MKLEGSTLTDASLLIGLGRFDEAELVLIELLDAADADGDAAAASHALEGLGTIATRRGQETRALELFEQAIARGGHPDPAERDGLYWNTARLRSYTGDAEGAIALLEECLRRLSARPQPDQALLAHFAITLNYAYADAGEYGKARTILADVLQRSEDLDLQVQRRLYTALCRININTGRPDLAVEYAEKMLEIALVSAPVSLHDVYLMAAHTRLDTGDTEIAGRYLEQARAHAPQPLGTVDEGFLLVEEARYSLQHGDHEPALARARLAIDLLGDQSVPGQLGLAYLVLARVYDDTGRDDQADRAYLMAIDGLERQAGWPTDLAKAYRRYGKFLRRVGRSEDAMRMLELASDTGA
jgi:tetratricopeptide (TPR) repeat protein